MNIRWQKILESTDYMADQLSLNNHTVFYNTVYW